MGRTKKIKINEIDTLEQQTLLDINKLLNFEQNHEQILTNTNHSVKLSTYDYDIINISDFKKKEKMLYDVLDNFFTQCVNDKDEILTIINIINGTHSISLRFLDWFVTRYCYLYKLSIPLDNLYNKEKYSNINISYKAQLKSFKKRYFDPFRRKKKFNYVFSNHNLNIFTTLGQLNFFRWALSFDIIKYVKKNFDSINDKMSHVNSYFKKNIIDTNSLTITTSDENSDFIEGGELKNISQNNSDSSIDNNNLKKNIKPSKIFNELKNSQSTYKYPQVSRNIFLEF